MAAVGAAATGAAAGGAGEGCAVNSGSVWDGWREVLRRVRLAVPSDATRLNLAGFGAEALYLQFGEEQQDGRPVTRATITDRLTGCAYTAVCTCLLPSASIDTHVITGLQQRLNADVLVCGAKDLSVESARELLEHAAASRGTDMQASYMDPDQPLWWQRTLTAGGDAAAVVTARTVPVHPDEQIVLLFTAGVEQPVFIRFIRDPDAWPIHPRKLSRALRGEAHVFTERLASLERLAMRAELVTPLSRGLRSSAWTASSSFSTLHEAAHAQFPPNGEDNAWTGDTRMKSDLDSPSCVEAFVTGRSREHWLQVELLAEAWVARISVLGRHRSCIQFVTLFAVGISNDGKAFNMIQENGTVKLFKRPPIWQQTDHADFEPVRGRYVRIYPLQHHGGPSMFVDIIGGYVCV